MEQFVAFPSKKVKYTFGVEVNYYLDLLKGSDLVLITDTNLVEIYPQLFADRKTIVVPEGETSKNIKTIEHIINQLLKHESTRETIIIGIGGGVITDIVGFIGSTYMRGVAYYFVPTTLLAMVDASIGGKNGVNIGLNKNIIGTINQPDGIIFDSAFLATLPEIEWSNGFAEVIKYACIFDKNLFNELERESLLEYKIETKKINHIITTCVALKNKTVIDDEHEHGIRKLLNFGHTAAHAIENLYHLPHGQAVAIGMMIAAKISEEVCGLSSQITERLRSVIKNYGLPTNYNIDIQKAMELLKMDKKRAKSTIQFIVLNDIGDAAIQPLPFPIIEQAMKLCAQ